MGTCTTIMNGKSNEHLIQVLVHARFLSSSPVSIQQRNRYTDNIIPNKRKPKPVVASHLTPKNPDLLACCIKGIACNSILASTRSLIPLSLSPFYPPALFFIRRILVMMIHPSIHPFLPLSLFPNPPLSIPDYSNPGVYILYLHAYCI